MCELYKTNIPCIVEEPNEPDYSFLPGKVWISHCDDNL